MGFIESENGLTSRPQGWRKNYGWLPNSQVIWMTTKVKETYSLSELREAGIIDRYEMVDLIKKFDEIHEDNVGEAEEMLDKPIWEEITGEKLPESDSNEESEVNNENKDEEDDKEDKQSNETTSSSPQRDGKNPLTDGIDIKGKKMNHESWFNLKQAGIKTKQEGKTALVRFPQKVEAQQMTYKMAKIKKASRDEYENKYITHHITLIGTNGKGNKHKYTLDRYLNGTIKLSSAIKRNIYSHELWMILTNLVKRSLTLYKAYLKS